MDKNSMMHYGIKGMKWGVRRSSISSDSIKSVKKKIDSTNEGIKSASEINKTVKSIGKSNRKAEDMAKTRVELSKMSDAQLRDRVNRLNMEERYTQVMDSRYSDKGKDVVGGILSAAGTALAIGSSAASIALAIKELRG